MPNEFKFDSNGPCYRGEDQTIEKNGQVRLKIVGLKHQATQIVSCCERPLSCILGNVSVMDQCLTKKKRKCMHCLFFPIECCGNDKGGLSGPNPISRIKKEMHIIKDEKLQLYLFSSSNIHILFTVLRSYGICALYYYISSKVCVFYQSTYIINLPPLRSMATRTSPSF